MMLAAWRAVFRAITCPLAAYYLPVKVGRALYCEAQYVGIKKSEGSAAPYCCLLVAC